MFAPQQEHCQCAAFIGRSIRTAGSRCTCASTPSSCAALKTARSLRAAMMLRAPWSALGCVHSERRSDFHCVLNHRGRRGDVARTIISATCWSDTPGLRSSMRASRQPPQYPRLRSTNNNPPGGNIAVNPPKCPNRTIPRWPCSECVAPVGSFACQYIRQSSLVYKWRLARYLLRPGYSAYPAAMRGDLMRCADPERIATLAADHRNFGR